MKTKLKSTIERWIGAILIAGGLVYGLPLWVCVVLLGLLMLYNNFCDFEEERLRETKERLEREKRVLEKERECLENERPR